MPTATEKFNHADDATKFVANHARAKWHDQALWFVRQKRDRMANSLPEWEALREMAAGICQKGSPVGKGKPEGWAAGIVYALGRVNFLDDPNQTPHLKSAQIAEGFGVSMAAMQARKKVIWDGLDLMPLHPDWCLSSLVDDNPMIWMLSVNGFILDIRTAPREAQVVAYEKGLIPYIPADREDSDGDGAAAARGGDDE